MGGMNHEQAAIEHIRQWVNGVAHLPKDTGVEVREEPHCPDPTCPLLRTVLEWVDAAGKKHRVVIVKPLVYVRQADVERAVRRVAPGG
jgi:hypothetical protein